MSLKKFWCEKTKTRMGMGILTVIAAGIFIFSELFGSTVTSAFATRMIPDNFSELAKKVAPAVVNIRTEKTGKGQSRVFRFFNKNPFGEEDPFRDFHERFFGGKPHREFKQRSLGSGFIIDKAGYIVTNNHVVEDADKIKVIMRNEKEYDAKIIGRDPNTDLALIKVEADALLAEAVMGDSDKMEVGEWVIAIGSPFGLEQTVTAGIISAKGRVIGSGPYDDFIQTDASINPGNSGGPLINLKGEVVGINTAIIAGGAGIGFAIPINLASGIITQLKSSGEVSRGWLGVAIQDISPEMGEYYNMKDKKGALVASVFPGDPADKAGIKAKDIILSIDDEKIESSRDLTRIIADQGAGKQIQVKVLRNGETKSFTVALTKRKDAQEAPEVSSRSDEDALGIRVAKVTPEMAQRFNMETVQGVMVTNIEPGSKAADSELMVGDLIKEINHEEIKSVADYKNAIEKVKEGDSIYLFVNRINRGVMIVKLTK
jgi:serine protease Do